MKKIILLSLLIIPASLFAQPAFETLQNDWVQGLQSGNSVSDFYWPEHSLIFSKIITSDSAGIKQLIRSEALSGTLSYIHQRTYEHDQDRFITVGRLQNEAEELLLTTGWREVDGAWYKEMDVLLTIETETTAPDSGLHHLLAQERERWVELANQHNPEKHINYSYAENATYFSNGRKSNGREEIADRYFYMENSNYQVQLEKQQLWKLSESRVLEIGRYFAGANRTGNGGLYIILWELHEDGQWKIELDFNF